MNSENKHSPEESDPVLNAESEWMPIATAPRDATRVLIAVPNDEKSRYRVYLAWWAIPYEAAPDSQGWWTIEESKKHTILDHAVHGFGATYWRPLPGLPETLSSAHIEDSSTDQNAPLECYSTDGDHFDYDDWEDAADYALDDPDVKVGDVRVIYKAIALKKKLSDYADLDIFDDQLSCAAADIVGEYSEDWPCFSALAKKELKVMLDAWATKHDLHPYFYEVANIEEMRVRLLDGDKYEIVKET